MIDSIDSVLIDSEVVGISYYLCEGSFDDDDGFLVWSHCCAGRTSDSDVKAKADSKCNWPTYRSEITND